MAIVITERAFRSPKTDADMWAAEQELESCMALHAVRPRLHYLARDGSRVACIFDAPDAEAMRRVGQHASSSPPERVWTASLHGPGTPEDLGASPVLREGATLAVVERNFAEPVAFDEIDAMEDGTCLALHRVRFLRSYFALDGRRMLCLYEAPDLEAVRATNRKAGLPFDRIWAAMALPAAAARRSGGG